MAFQGVTYGFLGLLGGVSLGIRMGEDVFSFCSTVSTKASSPICFIYQDALYCFIWELHCFKTQKSTQTYSLPKFPSPFPKCWLTILHLSLPLLFHSFLLAVEYKGSVGWEGLLSECSVPLRAGGSHRHWNQSKGGLSLSCYHASVLLARVMVGDR